MKYLIGLLIMVRLVYISAVTNEMNQKQSEYWGKYWAKKYKIEFALVKAIAKAESRIGIDKERYEPHLKKANWYIDILSPAEKKDPYSYYSMGDMHILFGIAKKEGFKGKPHELMHPQYNYQYGIKYFKNLCIARKGMNIDEAISSYNQGLVKKKDGSIYLCKFSDKNKNRVKEAWEKWNNQIYVNKVLKNYKKFGGSMNVKHLIIQ
jgi:soluble lytic murein transglycosylase-like protein